ncbi:DUF4158 domain-containing protein [Bacillus subtilis]|uniref:DUF4158 domain-containing protein n=1 Tax=Bacillus subtilis TaxID=1423 RepID=UPI00301D36CD
MPSIQDTIYPRFKSNLTEKDLEEVYTPKINEIEWAEAKSKGTLQQLALLVLIKTVQKLGFFIHIVDVPEAIVIHIAKKAHLPLPTKEEWKTYSETRTAKRHFRFVRDYLQLRPFDHEAHHSLTDTINKLAFSKDDPADLVNAAIEELIRLRYELPVYNTLKDAANDVRNKSYRAIYHQIDHALNDEQKRTLINFFRYLKALPTVLGMK